MLGRVTPDMVQRSLVSTLQDLTDRITTSQQQVSTGKRITQPSDDPIGTQRAIQLSGSLAGTQQYKTTVSDAQGWLQTSDDALGQIGDVINRVHELTVQGGNDATSPQARQSIALEIDQLIASVKQTANASYDGVHVFSGTATTTAPYSTASDAYAGDGGKIFRTIGPGVTVQVNTDLGSVLGSGSTPSSDGKLIDTLRSISAHLKSGTTADADALRTTDLAALDSNQDSLNNARATVGATVNRLTAATSRLSDIEVTTQKVLSDTQDADLAQSILQLTSQQNALQAALKSGASVIQPSLLDFLSS